MNNTVMNKSSNVEDTDNKEIEAIRDSLKNVLMEVRDKPLKMSSKF